MYFRSLQEISVKRDPAAKRPIVQPVAFIIETDYDEPEGSRLRDWVVGIAVRNPNLGHYASTAAEDLTLLNGTLANSELLICDLRSHHPLGRPKGTYRLWLREWTSTSDALIVRAVVDWDDD